MTSKGFIRGIGTPCASHLRDRDVRVVVHGDDFAVLRYDEQLNWFRRETEKNIEVKFRGRIGPGNEDNESMRILNRVVEWTEEGINYEADQRHAKIIIKHLGEK